MSQEKKKKAVLPPARPAWIGSLPGHAMQTHDPEYLRTTTLALLSLRQTFDADLADLAAAIDRLGGCEEAYALVQNQGHSASALLIQIASDDCQLLDCQFPDRESQHYHSFHSALQNLLISYSVGTEDAAITDTIQGIVTILDTESNERKRQKDADDKRYAEEKLMADLEKKVRANIEAENPKKPRRGWVLRVLFGE